jgi:hypothetical protein
MRVVPARNGLTWLVSGFAFFRKSPPMWLFLVFTYYVAVALLGQIRYLGSAVSTVLLPALFVSFMAMCAVLERGGLLRPVLLFAGFRNRLGTLIALGVVFLLSIVVVLAFASLADAGVFMALILSGQAPSAEALQDGSLLSAMMVASLAATPVAMAFWFAPVLAAWNSIGAAQSLFYSFFAVLRNWRAFFVYGAVLALAWAGLLAVLSVVFVMTQGNMRVLSPVALILILASWPTLFASLYASYRDIFPENAVPAEPPAKRESP